MTLLSISLAAMFVDLVKGLSWPVVVAVVLIYYRSEFGILIPRMTEAGPTGVKFGPAIKQMEEGNALSSVSKVNRSNVILPAPTPAVAIVEEIIQKNISEIEKDDQVRFLVRDLASARVTYSFERIYNIIFGSQIEALKRLNQNVKVSVSDAQEFFNEYYKKNPDAYPYGFDGWVRFLKEQVFVKEEDGMFEITDIGREFLGYMILARLSENKPL